MTHRILIVVQYVDTPVKPDAAHIMQTSINVGKEAIDSFHSNSSHESTNESYYYE